MSAGPTLQSQAMNSRLWSRAAFAALALHLCAFGAALIALRGELDEDAMGSPAIEISLEPAAPKTTETPDEPPGPLTDAAAAAAPSVASSEATENNQPKITRTEAEDAEFSRRETPDKPVEKSPAPQAKPLVSNEFAASEQTAPPKSEVPQQSEKPVAPVFGSDAAAREVKLTWQKALMAHLNRAKRYPVGARRSTEVSVFFTLDRRGHVVSYSVKHSSGQAVFDEAALAMMKRADPVPAPPPVIADEGLSFEIPVQFRADHR